MPPFRLVDAFAATPFTGNPAGVVLLPDGPVDPDWAQAVAAEVGVSETAIAYPEDDGWRLRWWTPAAEVALCGHATLATAHVLWEDGHASPDARLRFHTRSGVLTAKRDGPRVAIDLPSWPVAARPAPPGLLAALGAPAATYVGRTTVRDQPNELVLLRDAAAVTALTPDLAALASLEMAGVIVTAPGEAAGGVDLVSRYFAPGLGVAEDPVTGSAHSTLGPFWAARLGRTRLVAEQRSARGGRLHLDIAPDQVTVGGEARTTIRGELLVRPAGRPARSRQQDPDGDRPDGPVGRGSRSLG